MRSEKGREKEVNGSEACKARNLKKKIERRDRVKKVSVLNTF